MYPRITVFTPAYNRAHTLSRCYHSLLLQDSKSFKWLIIDDGSTDQTHEIVKQWQKSDNGFEINYIYKENGGMHSAHNVAYQLIDTELNICIDSDDYLSEGAISKILTVWDSFDHENYAGLIGLDADFENYIIGTNLPFNKVSTTLSKYYANGGKGDKKLVYRTDIMKSLPNYPEFKNEKYLALAYKYLLCDKKYELIIMNEILCHVEYQLDGSSYNMYKQYLNNPRGFAFYRKQAMCLQPSGKRRFIECIHYVSSSIISNNMKFLSESPKKYMTILAIPFGVLLTWHIKKKEHTYMKIKKCQGG